MTDRRYSLGIANERHGGWLAPLTFELPLLLSPLNAVNRDAAVFCSAILVLTTIVWTLLQVG